jgi:hypothetical protein
MMRPIRRPVPMAGALKPISCRSCAKLLATISEAGLDPTSSATDAEPCETCERFLLLYNDMTAADAAYASFRERRDNYRPKQDAFVSAKQTRMAFNNMLIDVDAKDHTQSSLSHLETHPGTKEDDDQRSTKRSRSRSRSPKAPVHLEPTSLQEQHNSGPAPIRKRFRFSDNVELREDYRPSQYYARSEETYVRGRYAASVDGEHLDTSGNAKTFLKFTGMKKVGKEWIDVWKDDDEVENKKAREESVNIFDTSVLEDEVQTLPPPIQGTPTQRDAIIVDARAQRLARRKSAGSDAATTRKNATVKSRSKRAKDTKLPTLDEDIPTVSESVALNIGAEPKVVEEDARVVVPSVFDGHADVAALNATKVENGLEGVEVLLSEKMSNDEFTTAGANGVSEADVAHVEASIGTTEETHEGSDPVVSTEPRDGREDQHEAARNDVEIPSEVVEEERFEDNQRDTTNAKESIVVLHGRPQFPDISGQQSVDCGFGPTTNEAPERHGPATHLSGQPTFPEAQHSKLSSQASPAHRTASDAQHIAADAANMRNAGIDAGGEMLVMASRAGKDQPG